jgi:hypothetical protein
MLYGCASRAYLGGIPHHHLVVVVGRVIQSVEKVEVLRRGSDLILEDFDPLCQLLHIVNSIPKDGCPVHLIHERF